MRQVKALALMIMMILSLMLGSCAAREKGADELALEIRTDLLEAERLAVSADITADYGDRVYDFGIKYKGGAEEGEITILSPELIAGITAEVNISGCTLIYDGARLDTGALTTGGLSPVEALPVLISEWRGGYIDYSGYEKYDGADTVTISTSIDGVTEQKTWFDPHTRLPLRAEIISGGVMVIACVFNDVIIES